MQPSGLLKCAVYAQTVAGAPATGLVASDLLISLDGAAATVSGFTEMGTSGAVTEYQFSVAMPSTARENVSVSVQPAAPLVHVVSPNVFVQGVENYDLDAIAGLIQASGGTPSSTPSAASTDLGDVIMDHAWVVPGGSVTIPLALLSPYGMSDLTGFSSVTAKARKSPGDPASPVTVTLSVVSAASRTVKLYWDTWPSGLDLASTENSQTWYIDISGTETAAPNRVIWLGRYSINVVWDART